MSLEVKGSGRGGMMMLTLVLEVGISGLGLTMELPGNTIGSSEGDGLSRNRARRWSDRLINQPSAVAMVSICNSWSLMTHGP